MRKIWWVLIVLALILLIVVGLIIKKGIFEEIKDNVMNLVLPFLH